MEPTHVIKRPLITEKSTFEAAGTIPRGKKAGQPINRYSFEVDLRARKGEIAKAIEARGEAPNPIKGARSPRPTSAGFLDAATRLTI